jgi:hypothetical protein
MPGILEIRRTQERPSDKRISAPRCFQWVKKEDRGKSGTHELMKRNGGK